MSIRFKYQVSLQLQYVQKSVVCIFRYSFLFLSGTITLKTIFNYFQNYICIKEHLEKPTILLFQQYPVAPLVLHLAQWRLANEAESLMVVQYASKPRNPE
jgi:hypothetical protein